jgi:hypothetical protein
MKALPWLLCLVLAVSAAGHAWMLVRDRPTHAVLPIFVPVSLEHEAGMRAKLGQPARRGGEEAVELARALLDLPVAPEAAPAVERLRATRAHLLALRDRRHQLNVALMNVGVDLGAALTADQWETVFSHRDQIRAKDDAAVFDRLLEHLR